jgi:hypothetical protein
VEPSVDSEGTLYLNLFIKINTKLPTYTDREPIENTEHENL